jgi:multicomponent Na+:H+ antiporter subunit B
MISSLSAVLIVSLVVVAFLVASVRDVLAATVVFAAYSLVMAILWVTLQAPDVALTEAAVGAGVTTSLFLVVIVTTELPLAAATFDGTVRRSSVAAAVGVTCVLGVTLPALPAVGSPDAPAFDGVAPYYLDQSVPQLGIENVVTAILAGFRSFDTFGEVTVVFAAGVTVLVIFEKEVL